MRLRLCIICFMLCAGALFARDYRVFDVVGDSVSVGVNPSTYPVSYGWVQMLFGQPGGGQPAKAKTITNLWPGITLYNSAVSGSRASQWAVPGSSYMAAVTSHCPDLVVVMIGGNDGLAYANDGVFTEAEKLEFRSNLVSIVNTLRTATPPPEIVMTTYYDLFDGLSSNLPAYYANYRGISSATVAGNQMIREVATEKACHFVDVSPSFMHHCYGGELGDTAHASPDYVRTPMASFDIHPVTAGHEKLYDLVYATLNRLGDVPAFTGIALDMGAPTLTWSSGFGQHYVIERSTDLTAGFTPIAANAAIPPCNAFTDTVAGARGFYRIRVVE